MKRDFSDELALEMEKTLNDKSFQEVFAPIKLASKKETKRQIIVEANSSAKDIFNLLIHTSEKMERMGLDNSSILVLQAAEEIVEESEDKDKDDDKCEEDIVIHGDK